MGYKSVSLSKKVYEMLKAAKKGDKSFNDLIKRLLTQPSIQELLELAGEWSDVPTSEIDALRRAVKGDVIDK